jgi:TatD DNase family protein
MLKLIDTHAHLDVRDFQKNEERGNKGNRGTSFLLYEVDELIKRVKGGILPEIVTKKLPERPSFVVEKVLAPAITAQSSRDVVALAEAFPEIVAAVGYQPNGVVDAEEEDWRTITELAERDGVVAIGETGLDRYWDDSPFDLQVHWFERHLAFARERDLPILIHCRDAWDDLHPILREAADKDPLKGVIHAFSGNTEMAMTCVDLGMMISFAGPVTYRNKKFTPLWEAAQAVPDDHLLVETDSPYLTPHPFRGKLKANEPVMSILVAERLADLRGVSLEHIAEVTTENAKRLFRL